MPLAKKNVYKKSFMHTAVSVLNAEFEYALSDEVCLCVCVCVCARVCMRTLHMCLRLYVCGGRSRNKTSMLLVCTGSSSVNKYSS